MKFTRRDTLVLGAAASLASLNGIGSALAKDGDMFDVAKLMAPKGLADKVIGSPDAKVTVIEYASPTCSHCAVFSNEVLPLFETQYVDSGKVLFILRPFARNLLDAAIFMLAESAALATPPAADAAPATDAAATTAPVVYSAAAVETYHNVLATFFRTQADWGTSDKPRDAILAIAKQLGFTEESFNAALTNQVMLDGINAARDQAMQEFGLEGTPTFFINGKQLSGKKTIEQLAAEIDPLLA